MSRALFLTLIGMLLATPATAGEAGPLKTVKSIDNSIVRPLRAHLKTQTLVSKEGTTLANDAVMLVHDDGRFVYSTTRHADMVTDIHARYFNEKGRLLVHLHFNEEEQLRVEETRHGVEGAVRGWFVSQGYRPLTGFVAGDLADLRLTSEKGGVFLDLRDGTQRWRYRLGDAVKSSAGRLCAGKLSGSQVAGTTVILRVDYPSTWLDVEAGPAQKCSTANQGLRIELGAKGPVVHLGKGKVAGVKR